MQKQVGQVGSKAQDICKARKLEGQEKWQKKRLKRPRAITG